MLSRVGDQFVMTLDDVRSKTPWDGASPRSLTKCAKLFSLGAGGASRSNLDDPDQLCLYLQQVIRYG